MRHASWYRASARRRREGAIFVEALVVCVMLSLLLGCVVFAHRLYSTKIASMGQAREQAWMGALPGCEGGLASAVLSALSLGSLDLLAAADSAGHVDMPDWLMNNGRGVGEPTASVTTEAVMGLQTFSVQSRASVACNESGDDQNGSLLLNGLDVIRDLVPVIDR